MRLMEGRMEEVEVEILMDELPDVPKVLDGLARFLDLDQAFLGQTTTLDRLLDTDGQILMKKGHSLRLRQKLENIYAGRELRLTYKMPLREHETLFVREETKLKLMEGDSAEAVAMLAAMSQGFTGERLNTWLLVEETAREANLGPKGSRVRVSIDHCTYSLPDNPRIKEHEIVFELESHGVPEGVILNAYEWVTNHVGGTLAREGKYPRGLKLLGKG
jgi:hypothetical protein